MEVKGELYENRELATLKYPQSETIEEYRAKTRWGTDADIEVFSKLHDLRIINVREVNGRVYFVHYDWDRDLSEGDTFYILLLKESEKHFCELMNK